VTLSEYLRKRRLRAEVRRIQSDLVYVLSKVEFTDLEKNLLVEQAKRSIEQLELQVLEVERGLTVKKF
jgi:hypothetical protein